MYFGKDAVLRAAQMQVGTNFQVRTIQLLHLLELHCDVQAKVVKEDNNLNADAKEFRPRRNAVAIPNTSHQDNNAIDDNESDIWQYHYQMGGVCHK